MLPESIYGYFRQIAYREPAVLAQLREETSAMPMARMQIAPEQGQLMAMLVRLMGARRCLEVGVFTGYSSLAVALALPDDGTLLACDSSEEWTTVARRYWAQAGVSGKIELALGPALETLERERRRGAAHSYDFAFIDADKVNYLAYYERVLELLRPGGLLGVDNTLWSGRVADAAEMGADTVALREFNAKVATDDRVEHCLVPIADGLTLLRKR